MSKRKNDDNEPEAEAEGRTADLVETEVKEWPHDVDVQHGIDFDLAATQAEADPEDG